VLVFVAGYWVCCGLVAWDPEDCALGMLEVNLGYAFNFDLGFGLVAPG